MDRRVFLDGYACREWGAITSTAINQYAPLGSYKDATFSYNPDSQLQAIRRFTTSSELVSAAYDTYDELGRLRRITHYQNATQVYARHTMTYDAGDRLTEFISPDGTSTYTYDSIDQLGTATYSYQSNEGFSYDKNGNRTNTGYVTDTGNGSPTMGFSPTLTTTKAIAPGGRGKQSWALSNRGNRRQRPA